ncbi:MAG: hypothetical protein ACYTF0_00380 [Planctomycetota bacterium]|jgi:hypothetical protein
MDSHLGQLAIGLMAWAAITLLRRISRRAQPPLSDPEGTAVFHGSPTACDHIIDTLADAGIAAWRSYGSGGHAVEVETVDRDDASHILSAHEESIHAR